MQAVSLSTELRVQALAFIFKCKSFFQNTKELCLVLRNTIRYKNFQQSPTEIITTDSPVFFFPLAGPLNFCLQREAPRTHCVSTGPSCGMVTSVQIISTILCPLYVSPLWTVTTQSSFFFPVEI